MGPNRVRVFERFPQILESAVQAMGGRRRQHDDPNARVNNMSEQQFEDHMNELFLRDNQKPIKASILSQLPKTVFEGAGERAGARAENDHEL